MNEEKKFWEYVGKMGYPTSAKVLRYGSMEAKQFNEIRDFFDLDKLYLSGARIGWVSGQKVNDYMEKYWDVHLALLRIVEGKKAVIDRSIKMIKKNLEKVASWTKGVVDIGLIEWLDEGGEVSMEDIVNSFKIDSRTNKVGYMYHLYGELFGEEMKNRLIRTLQTLEISDRGINWVKENFERAKKEAQDKISEVEKQLKNLAKKAGIDYKQLQQKLL